MKKGISRLPLLAQKAELAALAALPDDRINTAGLPNRRIGAARGAGVFFARSNTN